MMHIHCMHNAIFNTGALWMEKSYCDVFRYIKYIMYVYRPWQCMYGCMNHPNHQYCVLYCASQLYGIISG